MQKQKHVSYAKCAPLVLHRIAFVLASIITICHQLASIKGVIGYTCTYTRADFPANFTFGSGTSAYQVEGAAFEDGRTLSTYDTFSHNGNAGGYTGDIACDEYHRYKEDVQLMADTGLDAYRFSISWSRLIPNGRGPANPKAVEYYNHLINELIYHGIQPHVTLLHYEIPIALEDSYGGWLNQQMLKDFTDYADVCFREFGDRVLHWTTFNEVNFIAMSSSLKPFTIGHNILLTHASVVRLYREKYQDEQHGFIGLNIYTSWFVPQTITEKDLLAAQRVEDYMIGWFMNPLLSGDYSDIMKSSLKAELPSFTEQESKLVNGSFDFIGLNCYCATGVKYLPSNLHENPNDFRSFLEVDIIHNKDVGGMFVERVLEKFKQDYGNPPIYIQENGFKTQHSSSLNDTSRIEYLNSSIGSMLNATRNGSDVRGYFQWSFLDLFEPDGGFEWGFGLYYIDHMNDPDLKRYPKLSAQWYSTLLKGKSYNLSMGLQQMINNASAALSINML